jgi:hypothetical protein
MSSSCSHVDILFDLRLPEDTLTSPHSDDKLHQKYPHIHRLFSLIKHFYHPSQVGHLPPKSLGQFSAPYCHDCLHSVIPTHKDTSSMNRRCVVDNLFLIYLLML